MLALYKMKIAIVTPTTGNPYLARAIYSVRYQSVPVDHYVFVDGKEYWARAYELTREYKHLKVVQLPENTGKGGFNGHRIYAACSHLVNADYVLLLDEDCFYEANHAQSICEFISRNGLDWAYSLRNLVGESDEYLCHDDCDSLGMYGNYAGAGYGFVDTNCFAYRIEALKALGHVWNNKLYQTDVIVSQAFMQVFPKYGCSGEYTVNYRLHGKALGKLGGWFMPGNANAKVKHPDGFPWNVPRINEPPSVQSETVL